MMGSVGKYTDNGRLASLRVGGVPLTGRIADSVVAASLDVGRSAATQLSLTVVDPDLALLSAGVLAKGTPVTYGPLKLAVAVRSLTGINGATPALDVRCRPAGWSALKRARGAKTWHDLSPTDWAREAARRAGMAFLGEPTPRRKVIVRKHEKGQRAQSDKDVLDDLVQVIGFEWFEAEGRLYFGRPSWFARNLPAIEVRFDAAGTNTHPQLVDVPGITDSDDDEARGYSASLSVLSDLAEDMTPARAVVLRGVGPYSSRYLPQSWQMDLAQVGPVSVSLATPVNPDADAEAGTRGDDGGVFGAVDVDNWTLPVRHYTIGPHGRFGDTGVSIRTVPHQGLDFRAKGGTPVYAVGAGTVVHEDHASSGQWYGNRLQVRHGDGSVTWYCHLSRTHRHSGKVKAGELIAYVGQTGNTTGDHLHFEVHPGGGRAVDPYQWLRGKGLKP